MVSTLVRLPPRKTAMPEAKFIGCPLNNHSKSMGRSPEETRQLTETESSKLAGVSPKSKGVSFGGAAGMQVGLGKGVNRKAN